MSLAVPPDEYVLVVGEDGLEQQDGVTVCVIDCVNVSLLVDVDEGVVVPVIVGEAVLELEARRTDDGVVTIDCVAVIVIAAESDNDADRLFEPPNVSVDDGVGL